MLENIEKLKEEVQGSLEKNFIDNASVMKKEMELLNLLITSFVSEGYTYDEFCKCRMQFELTACDNIDIDFELENDFSKQDQEIVRNRAVRKHMENQSTTIYEEVFKEEYINWLVEKSIALDKKVFTRIIYDSSILLLKEKIKGDVWNSNQRYFEDICNSRAKKFSEIIANNNKERHEDEIRASQL
jgi:hypothetical protein